MAEPIEMSFGIWTWVGPSNYVLDGVHISTCQGAIFRGRTCRACPTALCQELCKNGWTGRDAVWVVESDGPKDACIRWGTHWHHLANTTEPSRLWYSHIHICAEKGR